ncbi:hypothetical protein ACX3X6_05140 [Pseudomonas sichuanensis]
MASFSVAHHNRENEIEMQTREAIQAQIRGRGRGRGQQVSRWRACGYEAASEPTPLLQERRPSGYQNWFVVEKGKTIWWIYSDTSDGGSWSSEGIKITGYRIPYNEGVAAAIFTLVYDGMVKDAKD